MDEIESKEQKPKFCRLAIWSPLLLISFWLLMIISSFLFKNRPDLIFLLIFTIFVSASIVTGILGLYKIHKSKGGLRGRFIAILGIAVALFFIFLMVFPASCPPDDRIVCAQQLIKLGISLNNYSKENGDKYPAPDKWCDLIKKYIRDNYFICPSSKAKKCSYAINPNCEPNSPNDIVLLFETKDGWNQFGGSELLTTENHEGKGCIILFNDGHMEFVRPDEIGKLKWKAE